MIQRLPELPAFPSTPAVGDAIFLTAFDPGFPLLQPDRPYVCTSTGPSVWLLLNVDTPVRDVLRSVDFPNRVRFTGRDFQTIEDELRAALAEKFGASFNDFLLSDLGVMFIQTVAFACDNLAFYQDQQATEVYLDTALLLNNVIRLVRNLGYKVPGASPSTVDLTIVLDATHAFPVTFPKGFQIVAGNAVFELAAPITFPAGVVSFPGTVFGAVQGETIVESFITAATPNQVFKLMQLPAGKFVAENVTVTSLLSVSVDGTTWDAANFPNDPTASDPSGGEVPFLQLRPAHIFEVERAKTPPEVRFGDNVAGLVPAPVGAEVKVTYLATLGRSGNVVQNAITGPRNPLIVAGNVIGFTVTHPASSGGLDPKTADDVRPLARGVFAAQGRAVSEGDWDAFANNFTGVGMAKALIIRGIQDDVLLLGLLDQVGALLDNPAPPSHVPPFAVPLQAATVKASLTNILNVILSTLCKANHVEILVLAKDINGDYVAPSSVLLSGLQTFMKSIAVLPVTVQAVDASPQIVPTDVAVTVKFDPSANKAALTQQLGTAVVTRLRGRQFGVNLRISDLYDDTDLVGLSFRNIQVTVPLLTMPIGSVSLPHGDGFPHPADVVLAMPTGGPSTFVITKGAVTVTDADTLTVASF